MISTLLRTLLLFPAVAAVHETIYPQLSGNYKLREPVFVALDEHVVRTFVSLPCSQAALSDATGLAQNSKGGPHTFGTLAQKVDRARLCVQTIDTSIRSFADALVRDWGADDDDHGAVLTSVRATVQSLAELDRLAAKKTAIFKQMQQGNARTLFKSAQELDEQWKLEKNGRVEEAFVRLVERVRQSEGTPKLNLDGSGLNLDKNLMNLLSTAVENLLSAVKAIKDEVNRSAGQEEAGFSWEKKGEEVLTLVLESRRKASAVLEELNVRSGVRQAVEKELFLLATISSVSVGPRQGENNNYLLVSADDGAQKSLLKVIREKKWSPSDVVFCQKWTGTASDVMFAPGALGQRDYFQEVVAVNKEPIAGELVEVWPRREEGKGIFRLSTKQIIVKIAEMPAKPPPQLQAMSEAVEQPARSDEEMVQEAVSEMWIGASKFGVGPRRVSSVVEVAQQEQFLPPTATSTTALSLTWTPSPEFLLRYKLA